MSSVLPSADKVVCHCLRVTESQIRDVLAKGKARHVYDVIDETRAGSNCHSCKRDIKCVMAEEHACSRSPYRQSGLGGLIRRLVGHLC